MVKLLELQGITKRFAGTTALNQVSLSLGSGTILSLVGENGAGKSTLMKILSGVHQPDAGSILLDGRPVRLHDPRDAREHGISIIYQEFSLVPHLTVVENLFLGRELTNRLGISCKHAMRQQAQAVLRRLGTEISVDATVARLGIAQQQYVEIAKALLVETRVLIMDEPTATLTVQEADRLLQLMRELVQQGISIIFISHHLDEVFAISDDIVCLRDGCVVGQRRSGEITHDELINLMVGRELNTSFPTKKQSPSETVLLDVKRLQRKPGLPANSFQLHAGEIVGIAGLVGSGRTKMVRALIGAERASEHEVEMQGRRLKIKSPADARHAGIGLVPEDRKGQGLVIGANVAENLILASLQRLCHPVARFIQPSLCKQAVKEQIAKLQIKASSPRQIAATLSGGNQQKIVLGKWLLAGCKVLILDEPTRGIDVGAKGEIYRLLRSLCDQGYGILLISSEVPEVIGMSDRVMVMRDQSIVHQFPARQQVTEEAIMTYAAGGVCV